MRRILTVAAVAAVALTATVRNADAAFVVTDANTAASSGGTLFSYTTDVLNIASVTSGVFSVGPFAGFTGFAFATVDNVVNTDFVASIVGGNLQFVYNGSGIDPASEVIFAAESTSGGTTAGQYTSSTTSFITISTPGAATIVPSAVPEPATMALLAPVAFGAFGYGLRRWRRSETAEAV